MTHKADIDTAPARMRRDAGRRADLSGRAAEARVADAYEGKGYEIAELRWRGESGEIDLIFRHGDLLVFAEVKKARTVDAAIASLRPVQMQRIHATASEYLAFAPGGQLSDVRFDLAAVDGAGRVEIIENAFGHF